MPWGEKRFPRAPGPRVTSAAGNAPPRDAHEVPWPGRRSPSSPSCCAGCVAPAARPRPRRASTPRTPPSTPGSLRRCSSATRTKRSKSEIMPDEGRRANEVTIPVRPLRPAGDAVPILMACPRAPRRGRGRATTRATCRRRPARSGEPPGPAQRPGHQTRRSDRGRLARRRPDVAAPTSASARARLRWNPRLSHARTTRSSPATTSAATPPGRPPAPPGPTRAAARAWTSTRPPSCGPCSPRPSREEERRGAALVAERPVYDGAGRGAAERPAGILHGVPAGRVGLSAARSGWSTTR